MSELNPSTEVVDAPEVAAEPSSLGRWLLIAGLIVALGLGLTALMKWLPSERSGDSRLDFPATLKNGPPGKASLNEDPIYHFGVLPQQTTGTHTWELKNAGQGDLVISQGATTCSCLIASLKGKALTLKPGESTPIILTWETREFDGSYERSSDINLINDPDREVLKLVVKGTVRPAVAVMPKEKLLAIGVVRSDQSQTTRFAIASADRPDLKVLSITTTNPEEITATAVPLPEADKKALEWEAMRGGYMINVEVKPTTHLGVFAEDVIVTTDHPHGKEVKVRVGGRRDGPVSLIPGSAVLHSVDSDSGGSTSMMMTVQDGADTKIEVAEKPDNLKVEVVPVDVKTGIAATVRQFRLIVTVPPGTAPCEINQPIILKSNHPAASRVTVPVDIVVLESL